MINIIFAVFYLIIYLHVCVCDELISMEYTIYAATYISWSAIIIMYIYHESATKKRFKCIQNLLMMKKVNKWIAAAYVNHNSEYPEEKQYWTNIIIPFENWIGM